MYSLSFFESMCIYIVKLDWQCYGIFFRLEGYMNCAKLRILRIWWLGFILSLTRFFSVRCRPCLNLELLMASSYWCVCVCVCVCFFFFLFETTVVRSFPHEISSLIIVLFVYPRYIEVYFIMAMQLVMTRVVRKELIY